MIMYIYTNIILLGERLRSSSPPFLAQYHDIGARYRYYSNFNSIFNRK